MLTDRGLCGRRGRSVVETVEAVLAAGCRAIQLRDKDAAPRETLELAWRLLDLTRPAGALLFINDRLDVALAAGADGVHLGPDDLPVAAARRAAGDRLLLGWSGDDPDEAARAQRDGADYVGCGDVFGTSSKADAGEVIGLDGLARVVAAVDVPVVGIGGVTVERAARVVAAGAAGVAVLSEVMGADDPGAVTARLLEAVAAPG